MIVIFLIVLQIVQYGYLFISLQRKGQFKMNAMGVTIICALLGLIFEIIWALSFVLEVFTGSDAYYNAVGGTVGVPGEAFCVFAAMTVCLMWNQVATASKSMKKTTDKMDKKPLYFVCTMCGSFALLIIALSIAIPRSIAILGTWWENPEPDYYTRHTTIRSLAAQPYCSPRYRTIPSLVFLAHSPPFSPRKCSCSPGIVVFYIAIADVMYVLAGKKLVAVMGGNKKDGKVNLIITTARTLAICASTLIVGAILTVLMRVLKKRGTGAAVVEIIIYILFIQVDIVILMHGLCKYILVSTRRKRGFTPAPGMTTMATTTGSTTSGESASKIKPEEVGGKGT